MKTIRVSAAMDRLEEVQSFVEGQLEEAECPMRELFQVNIAVEEIFVNIASYAYPDGEGEAEVSVELFPAPKKVVVCFQDGGVAFDPLKKEDADTSPEALERRIGGLGILMVKKSMDAMYYERRDGKNVLTIEKLLPEE